MSKDFQNSVNALFQMWQDQSFPQQLGWAIIHRKGEDDRPCLHWSISNYLIMLYVGRTHDARTYLAWRKAGRTVLKGSRAFNIIQPLIKTVKDKDTGEDVQKLIGFKQLPVFSKEQTIALDPNSDTTDVTDYTPAVIPELSQKIIKVLENWGVTVEFRPIEEDRSALGYFQPHYNNDKGHIVLAEESTCVLAHETYHYLDHCARNIDTVDNNEAEIIAELGSSILLSMAGISGYEQQSWDYLKLFIADAKSDTEVIRKISKVLTTIEKYTVRLLEAIENLDNIKKEEDHA